MQWLANLSLMEALFDVEKQTAIKIIKCLEVAEGIGEVELNLAPKYDYKVEFIQEIHI